MTGENLRALRERLRMTQLEFATWLNELMGRRYDKQKISRWETDRERLPREVLGALSVAALGVDRSPRQGLGITVGPSWYASAGLRILEDLDAEYPLGFDGIGIRFGSGQRTAPLEAFLDEVRLQFRGPASLAA